MKNITRYSFAIAFLLGITTCCIAQEDAATVYYGKKYIDINIRSTEKYNHRVEKQQKRLLQKLKRKETRFGKRLKRKDSTAYSAYKQDPLTYDSISKLQKPDSATLFAKTKNYSNASSDSLTRVKSFIEKKAHVVGEPSGTTIKPYDNKIKAQAAKQGYNQYLNELINRRAKKLNAVSSSTKGKINTRSINKNVFYGNERVKVLSQIKDEPTKLEEKALEHLQGQEGFDSYLKGEPTGMEELARKGMDATALEKMGYQTKQQMNAQLQRKFGGNTHGIQQKMGGDVQKWQDKKNKLYAAKNSAKQNARQLRESKKTIKNASQLEKPSFKVNPMKAQPFWRRIEKQYNWQTTRATLDGRPAIFQMSAMAGYKHTPRLTYGIGLAPCIGLGQDWNNIKLTFEGVGLRTFAEWKWMYGVGIYSGYERTYKMAAFDSKQAEANLVPNAHNSSIYSEAVVIGLTKTYSINEKWNGSVQVLYDIWWKDKGLRSPVIIRFATIKK